MSFGMKYGLFYPSGRGEYLLFTRKNRRGEDGMAIDRISGIVLLILAVFVAVETRVLPLGDHSNPGPGYLPLLLASILAVLSVVHDCTNQGFPALEVSPMEGKISRPGDHRLLFSGHLLRRTPGIPDHHDPDPGVPFRGAGTNEDLVGLDLGLGSLLGLFLGV